MALLQHCRPSHLQHSLQFSRAKVAFATETLNSLAASSGALKGDSLNLDVADLDTHFSFCDQSLEISNIERDAPETPVR